MAGIGYSWVRHFLYCLLFTRDAKHAIAYSKIMLIDGESRGMHGRFSAR